MKQKKHPRVQFRNHILVNYVKLPFKMLQVLIWPEFSISPTTAVQI